MASSYIWLARSRFDARDAVDDRAEFKVSNALAGILASVDRDDPAAIHNGQTAARPGMAPSRWTTVDLQALCGIRQFGTLKADADASRDPTAKGARTTFDRTHADQSERFAAFLPVRLACFLAASAMSRSMARVLQVLRRRDQRLVRRRTHRTTRQGSVGVS